MWDKSRASQQPSKQKAPGDPGGLGKAGQALGIGGGREISAGLRCAVAEAGRWPGDPGGRGRSRPDRRGRRPEAEADLGLLRRPGLPGGLPGLPGRPTALAYPGYLPPTYPANKKPRGLPGACTAYLPPTAYRKPLRRSERALWKA